MHISETLLRCVQTCSLSPLRDTLFWKLRHAASLKRSCLQNPADQNTPSAAKVHPIQFRLAIAFLPPG